jgi:L-ascorbate metabolism protein UlaG (beta-lactamase superfamily)
VAVTWIGHSTFLLRIQGVTVITDPMFSNRASPVPFAGPRRVRKPGVRLEDLPPIDVVLLSHNHYDHCDLPSLRAIAHRHAPYVITPLRNAPLLRSTGMKRISELDWWDSCEHDGTRFTLTPAQHFSARTPFDRNRALWGGFMFTIGARRVYFAGDSGYAPHFREIRDRLGAPDLALLPIGAYEPRWFMQPIHMNPAEAVQAHIDLGARTSIAMHFGTIQLTPEGIDEPVAALRVAMTERGVAGEGFVVPDAGWTAVV